MCSVAMPPEAGIAMDILAADYAGVPDANIIRMELAVMFIVVLLITVGDLTGGAVDSTNEVDSCELYVGLVFCIFDF